MSTASYTDPSSPVLSATCTSNNGVAVSAFTGATNGKGVWAQCNGTDGWAVLGIAALGSNSRGIVGSGGLRGRVRRVARGRGLWRLRSIPGYLGRDLRCLWTVELGGRLRRIQPGQVRCDRHEERRGAIPERAHRIVCRGGDRGVVLGLR